MIPTNHSMMPGDNPDGMIIEHIALHNKTVKIYQNYQSDGYWLEIEKFNPVREGWHTEIELPQKNLCPSNDNPNGETGFICIDHGVRTDW